MKTDNNSIKTLLERFYDGQTTEAEEKELRTLLEQSPLTDELAEEKAFFENLFTPEGLEQRLSRHIDGLAAASEKKTTHRRNSRLYRIAGIAASLLILVSAGLYIGRERTDPFYQDTFSTPEEAYPTAEKAITTLAYNIDKGMKTIEKIKF